ADSSAFNYAVNPRTRQTEKGRSAAEQENLLAFNSRRPKNSDWAFGASIGTYNQSEDPQAYHAEYLDAAPSAVFGEEYAVNVSNSDPEIVEYAPPVTFGLLVRKRLTSMFSLETGIDYSRLSTGFRNHFEPNYNSRLTLQYLGIPLQFVINWLNISDLTIYSSAGPMVEKGIKYDYSEHTFATRRYVHYTGSIDGFQWSAAASAGISYRFVKKWNVYLESHVSHFFDNNQPVSIRTEKRTIIGLNSGFRYDF
ncbi:MAG: outer membrane beta-barrel protein, partial [Bacteroidota bacterium]|nr:outer membrane beta-barrel protein [Bacteroidota bacterium]